MKYKNRPKWAKFLTACEWKKLVNECFFGKAPSLRSIRINVAYQKKHNIYCHTCALALRLAEEGSR